MRVDPRFERLFLEEYERVYRTVFVLCRDRAIAEDAVQEAFARCLERWNRLGDRPWIGGWVTSTALNLARRSLRRRGRFEAAPSSPGKDVEASIDLWAGIGSLPHYAADLPIAEVAALMNCQEGTVKAHLARARESLRQHMEGDRVDG